MLTVRVDRGPAYTPVPLDPAQAPGDGTHFVWSKRYCLLLSYCRHPPHQHCLASLESKILVCVLPSYTFLFVNCTCLSSGCPLKKICFLYSGWLKLKPVGRPQFFFFSTFFFFCENIVHFWRYKNEKKVSSRTFFSQPAGLPETELFLWTASRAGLCTVIVGQSPWSQTPYLCCSV